MRLLLLLAAGRASLQPPESHVQRTEQTPAEADPEQMLDLDLETITARLVDDDGRIVVALQDADGVAYLSVRDNPGAERALRRLRIALERLEPEVRRRTVGWRQGPFTGPGTS